MVQTSRITIGGKEYAIRCSIATVEYFERLTGTKFADVLSEILKVNRLVNEQGEDIAEHLDLLMDMQVKVIKMAYCMIVEANKKGENAGFTLAYPTLEDFMSDIESIDPSVFKGVLTVAQGVFPRQVQN